MNLFSKLRCVLLTVVITLSLFMTASYASYSPYTSSLSSFYLTYSPRVRARQAQQQRTNYDIIIAGAGTGGISAAIQASRMGAAVLVVESSSMIDRKSVG